MGFKRIIRFQNDFEQGQEKPVNSTLETSDSSKNDTLKVEQLERIWRPESPLECRIDPRSFEGEWIEHKPTTMHQKRIMRIYQDAKGEGRLHAFTCMTIYPSVKDGKLVYQKGLPVVTGFSQRDWEKMLKEFNPSRNSRQMTLTEYMCKILFIIQKLVKSGYEIEAAWEMVCDASQKIGHYRNSYNAKDDFGPKGSRNVCGFYDLGNIGKLIATDPWKRDSGFWVVGDYDPDYFPVVDLRYKYYYNKWLDAGFYFSVGMLAMD